MSVRDKVRSIIDGIHEDDNANGQQQGHDPAAVRALAAVRLAKRGGGERKLTVSENLMLRSLLRRPEERTDDDIQLLTRATSDVKFFQELSVKHHTEVVRDMRHEIVPSGAAIFEQGDVADDFYIIYRGSVRLYTVNSELSWSRTCIASLEDGASFGEPFLDVDSEGGRNASAVTQSTAVVLKIAKASYERTLAKLRAEDLHSVMRFLRSVFMFAEWEESELRRLASCASRRRFERNRLIISQGRSAAAAA